MHFGIGTVQIARKAEYASLAANRGSTYCRTPTEICHRRISLAAYFYVRSVNSVLRLHKSVGEKLIYCRKAQKVAASVAGNHGEVVGKRSAEHFRRRLHITASYRLSYAR